MSQTMVMMLAGLIIELLLLVLVLLVVAWLNSRGARRRDAKAAAALIARVKTAKPERAAAIEAFLTTRMGMEGSALAETKTAMLRGELTLLQRFAAIYKKHDAAAAARFDVDVVTALEPYFTLSAAANAADDPSSDEAIEILRDENKRLSDELKITMDTMSRMLNEYSTMFGDTDEAKVAAAVLGEASEEEPSGGADATSDDLAFDSLADTDGPVAAADDSDDGDAAVEGLMAVEDPSGASVEPLVSDEDEAAVEVTLDEGGDALLDGEVEIVAADGAAAEDEAQAEADLDSGLFDLPASDDAEPGDASSSGEVELAADVAAMVDDVLIETSEDNKAKS